MPATHVSSSIQKWFFCMLLILTGLIGSLSIDMYVPAMPAVAKYLLVSAKTIKLSLSLYLVPYALGQLFYGPLSDCFGRKRILLPAIALGMIGSACCAIAANSATFYAGRMLQGAGFSAIGATIPAMARDVFSDKKFAQISSILSLVFGLGPIFAPILGGYINHWFGWHKIFIMISYYALLVITLVFFFIPETHNKNNRHTFSITAIAQTYTHILKNTVFLKKHPKQVICICWISYILHSNPIYAAGTPTSNNHPV